MARYRKVDTCMWGDAKFRTLSDDAKFLWLYLLTGPETTSLPGLLVGGKAHFAEALGWSSERLSKAFQEVFRKGMAKADFDARVVWVCNASKYNPPQSPNVIKSWFSHFENVPECALKLEAFHALGKSVERLPKGFQEVFRKAFERNRDRFRNQEQEQEQEQEQDPLLSDQQTGQTELEGVDVGEPDPEPNQRNQAKEVWAHWLTGWRKNVGRGREPTANVWLDKIVTRLNTYTVDDLKAACDSQWSNPYLMGDNPDRKKYCGPEQVFDSNMRVEKRLNQAQNAKPGDPGTDQPARHLPYLVPDPEPTAEDNAAADEAIAAMRKGLFGG